MSLFRTWAAMFSLVLLGALASAALGERVPLHGGFGFEGWSVYRPIVQDLPGHLREGRIDAYSIQRVLPFAAAHLTLRALGQPLDDAAILTFFAAWNLIVLGLGVWVWLLVAADHGLSPVGRWLGFLGLFAGFAVLKLAFYYPVNIDPTALLVGLAALLFYRRGKTAGLVLVSLAGLAVWPTTLPLHALLLLLPARARWPDAGRRLPGSLALVVALALAVVAAFARTWLFTDRRPDPGIAPAVPWALPLAHLAVAAWIVLGLAPLVGRIPLRPAAWWPTVRSGLHRPRRSCGRPPGGRAPPADPCPRLAGAAAAHRRGVPDRLRQLRRHHRGRCSSSSPTSSTSAPSCSRPCCSGPTWRAACTRSGPGSSRWGPTPC